MSSENKPQPYTGLEPSNIKALSHIVSNCPVSTINEAITSGLPSLRKIELSVGVDAASGIVAISLFDIRDVLSFDLSPQMIKSASDAISRRFYDINPADLGLFKSMVIGGELGEKLYRLDARGLIELFEQYYDRREYELEQLRQRRSDEWRHHKPVEATPGNEKIRKMYEQMKAEVKQPKREQYKPTGKDVELNEAWQTCAHKFESKGDYSECTLCGSVVYGLMGKHIESNQSDNARP